jgi:hypothetical protein
MLPPLPPFIVSSLPSFKAVVSSALPLSLPLCLLPPLSPSPLGNSEEERRTSEEVGARRCKEKGGRTRVRELGSEGGTVRESKGTERGAREEWGAAAAREELEEARREEGEWTQGWLSGSEKDVGKEEHRARAPLSLLGSGLFLDPESSLDPPKSRLLLLVPQPPFLLPKSWLLRFRELRGGEGEMSKDESKSHVSGHFCHSWHVPFPCSCQCSSQILAAKIWGVRRRKGRKEQRGKDMQEEHERAKVREGREEKEFRRGRKRRREEQGRRNREEWSQEGNKARRQEQERKRRERGEKGSNVRGGAKEREGGRERRQEEEWREGQGWLEWRRGERGRKGRRQEEEQRGGREAGKEEGKNVRTRRAQWCRGELGSEGASHAIRRLSKVWGRSDPSRCQFFFKYPWYHIQTWYDSPPNPGNY